MPGKRDAVAGHPLNLCNLRNLWMISFALSACSADLFRFTRYPVRVTRYPLYLVNPDNDKSSIDTEKALGHGVCSLIEAALAGDRSQVLEWSRRVADRFERAGNLTVAARIRSLVRRASREEEG
jgi:hypothetical protein